MYVTHIAHRIRHAYIRIHYALRIAFVHLRMCVVTYARVNRMEFPEWNSQNGRIEWKNRMEV